MNREVAAALAQDRLRSEPTVTLLLEVVRRLEASEDVQMRELAAEVADSAELLAEIEADERAREAA